MRKSIRPIAFHGVSLSALSQLLEEERLAPVDAWEPADCGHSGMRIARDGTWFHDGTPIRRPAMVRLFSSVLRREPDGRYVLVTPAEKLEIDVDSVPFRAIEMRSEGEGRERRIAFRLDSDDIVFLNSKHPLRIASDSQGISPRVLVRHGLEAELTRPVYYDLVELALGEGLEEPGVWSDGSYFPLDAAG
jgi:hypothetical protein